MFYRGCGPDTGRGRDALTRGFLMGRKNGKGKGRGVCVILGRVEWKGVGGEGQGGDNKGWVQMFRKWS